MNIQVLSGVITMLFLLMASQSNAQEPMTESALTQEYLLNLKNSGYNRNIMPEGNHGYSSPVEVLCSMYIIDISKVDDLSMDFRAHIYFRQSWNDSRLAFLDQDIHSITLNDPSSIWTPDLFFVREKEGIHHNLIVPNTFVTIKPEGEVKLSVRLSMTISCPMDFRKYPHDTQKCRFTAESYGFQRNKLEVSWDRRKFPPVSYNENINLLPFVLKEVKEDIKYVSVNTGEFSALEVSLTFERKTGFYLTRLYIPFIFLVAMSWLSFWIPAKLIAVRLSLLLVILYLMVNIGSGINDFIPPASYTKGSDVWIAVCETLVFVSFLEFIAVHIISRNREKFEKRGHKNNRDVHNLLDDEEKMNPVITKTSESSANVVASRLKRDLLASNRIDKACRVLLPTLFVIFNFVYWLVYCTGH